MPRPFTAFLTGLLLLGTAPLPAAEPPALRSLSGEIEGARWAALVPENWDGRLLLEAPDCRQPPEPLTANLAATDPDTGALLAAGWALATTSYRRHGPLVADGIADLRALRDRLVEELGQPKLTLVEGTGMGGLIALFIAERHADEFHGCIAHDPRLDLRDPRALRLRYDHQPRAPLLLLATSATSAPAQEYIAHARSAANAESVVPVFWFVPAQTPAADKSALRLDAIASMEEWARTRQPPTDRAAPPEPETEAGDGEVPTGAPAAEVPPTGAPAVEVPPTAEPPSSAPASASAEARHLP